MAKLRELLKGAIKSGDVIIADGMKPEDIKQELIRYSKKTIPGSGMSFVNMTKHIILEKAYKILSDKMGSPVPS